MGQTIRVFPQPASVPANPLASCEIYDPATAIWSMAAPHPIAAGWRWAVVVKNGMVLAAGGAASLTSIEGKDFKSA